MSSTTTIPDPECGIMLIYLLKRSIRYLAMIFVTTSATYFLAVMTMRPALLEQEKIPRPTDEQIQQNFAS